MELEQRTRRFGKRVVLLAVLLRLLTAAVPFLPAPFSGRNEGGQDIRLSSSAEVPSHIRESPPPELTAAVLPRLGAEDAALVTVHNTSTQEPDVRAWLEAPLDWDLTGPEPAVLILHTHATECYTRAGESYQETSPYRTADPEHNMLSVGAYLADRLEQKGITSVQDRQLHDYPSYNGAYLRSRDSMQTLLEQYPSIRLVLDLHRDASGSDADQLRTRAEVEGETAAQLMLVMGTGSGGLLHKNWEENLSLAAKLQALLERMYPGITRPLSLRSQRFNQDLSTGALLVEVGAAGNTHAEALRSADALAEAICALALGVETE